MIFTLSERNLTCTVYNSLEDHHHEIMSFCWENGYHGVLSDEGEFALYNPPKYFSAHDLKLSYQVFHTRAGGTCLQVGGKVQNGGAKRRNFKQKHLF